LGQLALMSIANADAARAAIPRKSLAARVK
jgi:hypothetical protein